MNALKQTLNRAKQTVDEKFGAAEKTELDAELAKQLVRIDDIKLYTEKTLSNVQAYLQPDPTLRILPGMIEESANKPECVGIDMGHLGTKLGSADTYGKAMVRGAEAFNKLGQAEREFLAAATNRYVDPLKRFLNEDMKKLSQERSSLESKRLDMDSLKAKNKVGKEGSTNPEVDAQYRASVEGYQGQLTVVRELAKGLDNRLPELQQALRVFIEAHIDHQGKVQQILKDFHKQL